MKLKEYLNLNKISTYKFAEMVGANQSVVYRWAAEQQRPNWETIPAIMRATNGFVTAEDFVPYENDYAQETQTDVPVSGHRQGIGSRGGRQGRISGQPNRPSHASLSDSLDEIEDALSRGLLSAEEAEVMREAIKSAFVEGALDN